VVFHICGIRENGCMKEQASIVSSAAARSCTPNTDDARFSVLIREALLPGSRHSGNASFHLVRCVACHTCGVRIPPELRSGMTPNRLISGDYLQRRPVQLACHVAYVNKRRPKPVYEPATRQNPKAPSPRRDAQEWSTNNGNSASHHQIRHGRRQPLFLPPVRAAHSFQVKWPCSESLTASATPVPTKAVQRRARPRRVAVVAAPRSFLSAKSVQTGSR